MLSTGLIGKSGTSWRENQQQGVLPVSLRSRSSIAVLLVVGMLVLAGCGSSSGPASSTSASEATTSAAASSTSASEATTSAAASGSSVGALPTAKFVLHAGLAFGAFHRYIYKPFKAGAFSGGLFKHKLALAEAGLAGLFAYRELKLSIADAKASPILSRLLTPVSALAVKLAALGAELKGGQVEPSAIGSASGGVAGLAEQARRSGLSIRESIPSATQLSGAL